MQNTVIAPSILSADMSRLGEETQSVLDAGADFIHVDVMDNHFVPNLTFGPIVVKALRDFGIKAPLDVHLMIDPVDKIIPEFAEAGAEYISFHPEASKNVDEWNREITSPISQQTAPAQPVSPQNTIR